MCKVNRDPAADFNQRSGLLSTKPEVVNTKSHWLVVAQWILDHDFIIALILIIIVFTLFIVWD